MKESFIKFIIIALVAFFSVSAVYAKIDYSKPIWNTNIVIGYKPKPLNSDITENNKGFFAQRVSKQCEELAPFKIKKGIFAQRVSKQYEELTNLDKKYHKDKENIFLMIFISSFVGIVLYMFWGGVVFVGFVAISILLLIGVKTIHSI